MTIKLLGKYSDLNIYEHYPGTLVSLNFKKTQLFFPDASVYHQYKRHVDELI